MNIAESWIFVLKTVFLYWHVYKGNTVKTFTFLSKIIRLYFRHAILVNYSSNCIDLKYIFDVIFLLPITAGYIVSYNYQRNVNEFELNELHKRTHSIRIRWCQNWTMFRKKRPELSWAELNRTKSNQLNEKIDLLEHTQGANQTEPMSLPVFTYFPATNRKDHFFLLFTACCICVFILHSDQ